MPTPSETSFPMRSQSLMPSTSSASARPRSTRSDAGSSGRSWAVGAQERPALPHPTHPDDRGRTPHGQADRPVEPTPRGRRPPLGSHHRLALLPTAPLDLPRPQPAAGRRLAEKVIDTLPTCPIPEIARLGRTLRAWREQVLAYFTTGGVSNGGTEAINLIIEKTRRLAHGFRNFTNYRLCASCSPLTRHFQVIILVT